MNENTPIPLAPSSQENEIILYQPDSTVKLEVRLENETVWLTQQQIANLFGVKQPAISKHFKNIFESGELVESSVHSILEYTATDGKSYKTKFYNLDAILSVGYRVNSKNATLFRQWANKVLKEYLLRGYSINQRLMHMENRIDHRLSEHDIQIKELSNRMDFFVRTSLPLKRESYMTGRYSMPIPLCAISYAVPRTVSSWWIIISTILYFVSLISEPQECQPQSILLP